MRKRKLKILMQRIKRNKRIIDNFTHQGVSQGRMKLTCGTPFLIPDEWGYSDGTDSRLNQISQQLYDQEATLSNMDDDAYDEIQEQFQEQFLETVALAFETLRAEGIFAPETLCFISMSDDDRTPDIEDGSVQRLNTPEQYEQFQTWVRFFNG